MSPSLTLKTCTSSLFFVTVFIFACPLAFSEETPKHRVIVSSDIGGTDPDDFQSMVHLLLYADTIDLEGIISSPFGPGRKTDILHVIDQYALDYKNLKSHAADYPSPKQLRAISKQGETLRAPYQGFRQATEGSKWIIKRARVKDARPLYVLVWGGIEDLAQALHDAPDILPKLRVYYIGGPNKKWSPDAYQYIAEHHPKLWIIESNATYRGWFVGGIQSGEWGNKSFVNTHIAGRGAMADFFVTQLGGVIKMGDTPSLTWLFHETPEQADAGGWGGQYTRAWTRPYKVFERLTTDSDQIEEFSIFELVLPLKKDRPEKTFATMNIGNQSLVGHIENNKVHFRFCPKAAKKFEYTLESNDASLNGAKGSLTAVATQPDQAIDNNWPNWWVDNPAPEFKEGPHIGAKTVNRWRKDYLSDFAQRMARAKKTK
ncbi:Protein of unknown function [Alteromonadaceae bacterium Bs31]|nr:Protein of unknown function [Alteromonadaceae bacterium Bs31]